MKTVEYRFAALNYYENDSTHSLVHSSDTQKYNSSHQTHTHTHTCPYPTFYSPRLTHSLKHSFDTQNYNSSHNHTHTHTHPNPTFYSPHAPDAHSSPLSDTHTHTQRHTHMSISYFLFALHAALCALQPAF